MIKLQVIGNLGKNADQRQVNGQWVINFSVCHTETYMKDGEKVQKSIWVECAKWAATEQKVAQYLKKGTQVYVEGSPEVRTFSKNDGSTGHSLSLRVFDLQLLGGKKEGDGERQPNTTAAPQQQQGYKPVITPADTTEPIDDLPF